MRTPATIGVRLGLGARYRRAVIQLTRQAGYPVVSRPVVPGDRRRWRITAPRGRYAVTVAFDDAAEAGTVAIGFGLRVR